MLGDMVKVKGSVNVFGSTAYVPQQAWMQNATLKDNICFGKAYNNRIYKARDGNGPFLQWVLFSQVHTVELDFFYHSKQFLFYRVRFWYLEKQRFPKILIGNKNC